MIIYASAGNRISDPLLSSVSLKPLGYLGCWCHVNKTFTVLIYATILQELCVVCKGIYRKRKINHCLLTVSLLKPFKYEMIYTKEEIHYVLCANDYIWYLFFFIYYSLYCLHYNLFAYIVSLVWLNQSREINRINWWFMYNPSVAALPIWRHTKTVFSLAKICDNRTKVYFISTYLFLPS